jgi:hypothetical protein
VALCLAGCSDAKRPSGFVGASGGTSGKPATPSGGGDESDAAGAPAGGGGAAAVGGEAGEASVAGQPASAGGADGEGTAGEGSGGEPPFVEPFPDPICVGSGELSAAVKLPISTPDADRFGSITADELVIAWTVVVGDQVTLHYARRASIDDDFADARTLALDAASDAVTLSADGLRVVYVNSDRKGFTQLVRATQGEPFAAAAFDDFSLIAESTQELEADEYVGDPVLRADDSAFYYSLYGAGRSQTLLRTLRFSPFAPWPAGFELAVGESLEATDDERQQPTGVSLDGQTLFLWDSALASQRVATLSHETGSFDLAYELGDVRGAAPNGDCSRIYYDVDGDLWSAELR